MVEVGHPDGLGQPCPLTLLQGLGKKGQGGGGVQSLRMDNRAKINVEKLSVNRVTHQELALIIKRKNEVVTQKQQLPFPP